MHSVFQFQVAAALSVATLLFSGCGEAPLETLADPAPKPSAPLVAAPLPEAPTPSPAAFVKDTDCRSCHEPVFAEWLGSDHERAMAAAEVLAGVFTPTGKLPVPVAA